MPADTQPAPKSRLPPGRERCGGRGEGPLGPRRRQGCSARGAQALANPGPPPGGSSRGKRRFDGDFNRGKAERPPHVPRPPRSLSARPRPGPTRRHCRCHRRAEERGRTGSALHTCPGCLSSCARSGAAAVAAGAGARLCPSSAPLDAALRLTPRARARTRPPRRARPAPPPAPAPPRGARAAWEPAPRTKARARPRPRLTPPLARDVTEPRGRAPLRL